MKKISILFLTVFMSISALADHPALEKASAALLVETSHLQTDARAVIGVRPLARQRYAYEHIISFAAAAARFDRVLYLEETDTLLDDDLLDIKIVKSFKRLERAAYFARKTFRDLFLRASNGHSMEELNAILSKAEYILDDMALNLPELP